MEQTCLYHEVGEGRERGCGPVVPFRGHTLTDLGTSHKTPVLKNSTTSHSIILGTKPLTFWPMGDIQGPKCNILVLVCTGVSFIGLIYIYSVVGNIEPFRLLLV